MAFVSGPVPLRTGCRAQTSSCNVRMSTDEGTRMSRRKALAAGVAAAAGLMLKPLASRAVVDYENVEFLGGSEVIDINNANVRVYQKLPGLYPNIAKIIVSNGPYKAVEDLYSLPDLTANQKQVLEKYKDNLVALQPVFEYAIDKVNNGMYR